VWRASILTLYPDMFPGPLGVSLSGDARSRGIWDLATHDIRAHGRGRHRSVDDTPAGGVDRFRLLMSPRGRPLTQGFVRKLSQGVGVSIICGRFEGVDERVIAGRSLIEVSIGDYVLSGGEIAAMVLIDACVRLLPGVMGGTESSTEESFEAGLLEYPHFTRPREWEGRAIPDVLLSGDHKAIARWRRERALEITRERRPDLLDEG
jgi:tRNA (guanine37-N1)-methyltransferase